ncbi:MAG TPA: Ig-like domain-containing protein, partial [Thermoanaerobaculia bacterium]|nr:Ig-like domain-containing protein [Thermoanaerobaculia bacterium]
YPPDFFTEIGGGVYELSGLDVPLDIAVVAVPGSNKAYGHQFAKGRVRVDFNGQIGVTDLRLPGQGSVVTRVLLQQPNCGTAPQCYSLTYATASITYPVWNDEEQQFDTAVETKTSDPATNVITFTQIPAQVDTFISTVDHPAGYASATSRLGIEGDVRNIDLVLTSVGDISGRVFMHDRRTPAAGAAVRLITGSFVYATVAAAADGSWRFPAIPRSTGFRVQAEMFQDGIYRTGYADGSTSSGGGPVSNVIVLMREQSTIEGRVLDLAGAPVPLAKYWLRELAWPGRSFGSQNDPLTADKDGKFQVGNVFTGGFRITAVSPNVQEVRGDYVGDLAFEGDASQRAVEVRIGGAGTGSVSVTVLDPSKSLEPVENAEVTLIKGGRPFDVTSTNASGVAFFDQIPVGNDYRVIAYSKGRGRGGSTGGFGVAANQTSTLQIQLTFLGNVDGYVTDPESEPVANARVLGIPVTLDSYSSGVRTRASTDALGVFKFLGVPEGPFSLAAFDLDSGRMAFNTTSLTLSTLVPEVKDVHLELEHFADINVKAYLPTDNGSAGQLAPLVDVLVTQTDYVREAQGNDLNFRKMLPRYGFAVTVKELGGESREVKTGGSFGSTLHKDIVVVFPSSGSVEVTVIDGNGHPVQDARVSINGRILFTPANGIVSLSGVPFGWVTASATKGTVGASRGANLASRSIPVKFTLSLGNNAAAEGYVEAEGAAAPSVGTRVLMIVASGLIEGGTTRLETLTDATGHYRFTGIPIGNTRLTLTFYGPDDTTIGDSNVVDVPNGTTGTITLPPAKLDATPPQVIDLLPQSNSTNVSPSTDIVVTFSESIGASFLDPGQVNNWFQLIATDTGVKVNLSASPSLRPDGTYVVTLTPPPAVAPQKFPLKSNTLYRFFIPAGLQDSTGNGMKVAVGSSFTTVNYTEPAVVRVDPADDQPVASGTTFRVKFNKAIDVHSFDAGNGGVVKVEKLDSYKGAVIGGPQTITYYLDVTDPTTLVVAPQGWAIEEASFYRLTVSGAKDTQNPPNLQKDAKVVDYFSFDLVAPVATILSPVVAGEKLVSGATYTATVKVTEPNSTNEPKDVKLVDWFDAAGTHKKRTTVKPYEFVFVAPLVTAETAYTLQASATDLSNNESARATFTWSVIPNAPPQNLATTVTPPAAYPTKKIQARTTFTDDDLEVTVVGDLKVKHADGTDNHIFKSQKVTRSSITTPFPEVIFDYTIPDDAIAETASLTVTATDINQKVSSINVPVTITADTTLPELVSITPKSETHYQFNQSYTIEVKVRDNETKISTLTLLYDPKKPAETIAPTSIDSTTGIYTFRKTVTVPPKNAETRVHTVATFTDLRGNSNEASTDIIWDRVDDANIPTGEWITPLDGAALPKAQTSWQTKLRIRATDDVKVTSVTFVSSAIPNGSVSVTTPKSGTTDVFEASVQLTVPDAPFVITAQVRDTEGTDESHLVELPITIEPVALTTPPISSNFSISAVNINDYMNKSVFIRGAQVNITVPVTLKDLILVDGAVISTIEETKVDLTINDHVFVDADSRIDVSGKGYLGGLAKRSDNAFTNTSPIGRTLGGTITGGAAGADASYAGRGGEHIDSFYPNYQGTSNASYGSIKNPTDLGSGGWGLVNGNRPGGNGGGAVSLKSASGGLAKFVFAGDVRADFGTAANAWAGGSGGSVILDARTIVTGPWTNITANGADEGNEVNADAGGGGGRMSIRASERLDIDAALTRLDAHGGKNAATAAGTHTDGGAGTIHLVRPGAINGELIVSNVTTTNHLSLATPLSGDLAFDAITIGPRALVVLDAPYTLPEGVAVSVHSSAKVIAQADQPAITLVSVTPTAGSAVAQSTSIVARYTAQSLAGVHDVRAILSVQPNDAFNFTRTYPVTVAETPITASIPASVPEGPATLKLRVTDRAGRSFETAPVSFNVITNAAPTITQFDVTPVAMYAGHTITVASAASDDFGVTSLTLSSSAGTVTSQSPVTTGTSMSRGFTVAVPVTAAAGTPVNLTLSALDAFPNRVATTQTKSVEILHDTVAPSMTVARPLASEQFNEGAGATFPVQVTATDAEVAVKSVVATFEGTNYTLNLVGGVYSANLPVPSVDGVDPVEKSVHIVALDYENNPTATDVTIYVKPLIDPLAPSVAWICSSSGAMYPAGYELRLRVSASAPSGSSITSVVISVDGQSPLTITTPASGQWEGKFRIPVDAVAGTVFTGRAKATTLGGKETTITATFTVVSGTRLANSASTINANDTAFGPQSTYIVEAGGVLTIIGPRALKNLVVLDTGVVIHQQVSTTTPDALTVEKLYVGCDARIDVSAKGYGRNTSLPGIATPLDSSGGGHIGRGGSWAGTMTGATYGSIYKPIEKGGGGHSLDGSRPANGGGVLRLNASSAITIDGSIKANGLDQDTWGSGAGGSIWITTPGQISGGGAIEVRGGGDANNRSGGGGGAIAIEYGSLAGTLVNNLLVRGGISTSGQPGGSGSIYLKGPQSTYGDLIVDNRNLNATYWTELPWLGAEKVGAVNGTTATLAERAYIPESHVGNWVRVIAPDGSVRGTWRIASIANDPGTALPIYGSYFTSDAVTYDGYLIYTEPGYVNLGATRKLIAAKYENGQWLYDQDDGQPFQAFTPKATDRVFATFRKNSGGIYEVEQLRCGTTCGSINGIQIAEVVAGMIRGNTYFGQYQSTEARWIGTELSEFFFGYDGDARNFALAQLPPMITLESADGTAVTLQPGDTLRGIYRFDNVTIKGKAKVVSRDIVESTNAPVIESGSTYAPGDVSGPAIDATKVSFIKGKTSPIAVGQAGAVSDPDGKVDVFLRNAAKPVPPRYMETIGGNGMQATRMSTALQLRKINNNNAWGSISFKEPIGDYAYVSFRVSTVGYLAGMGLENHYFHFPSGGRWEVWVNDAWSNSGNKQGNLTNATLFRLERSGSTLRWYVDDVLQYETTVSNLTKNTRFFFSGQPDWADFEPVEYYSSSLGLLGNVAATNGSFSVPVFGAPGDAVMISARDRHGWPAVDETAAAARAWPQTTGEISLGTIPNDFGIQSVTFPNPITGGRTTTGTVTFRSAAGTDGALISLATPSTDVTLAASSCTIAAGATTCTVSITTKPVTGPVDVPITATWGGAPTIGTLQLVKDATPPSVTITQPAANAQFTEGNTNKIALKATIVDDDSGVKSAYATIDGQSYNLTKDTPANVWKGDLPVPFIDGTANVTKDVTVFGVDNNDNTGNSAALPVVIVPIVDASLPTVKWECAGSSDALFPVGYGARLRVSAKPPNGTNLVQRVDIAVTDPNGGTVVYTGSSLGSDLYEIIFPVPDVATDGARFNVHATALLAGGGTQSVDTSFAVMKGAVDITGRTIAANDATYNNASVFITNGTTTISGPHTFTRLAVLAGGNLVHANGDTSGVDITTTGGTYVECGASVDVSGRGYTSERTYPGEYGSAHGSAGSHLGRGGFDAGAGIFSRTGTTFGSIKQPREFGGGGAYTSGTAGGGRIHIAAKSFGIDGSVRANGADASTWGGGAGGSVWISTEKMTGEGVIEARGAKTNNGGGGGTISIEYSDPQSGGTWSSKLNVLGYAGSEASRTSAGGTMFVKGPSSQFGTVTIDHGTITGRATEFPSFGTRTVTSVSAAGAKLSGEKWVPPYFAGHEVEVTSSTGTVKGIARVSSIDNGYYRHIEVGEQFLLDTTSAMPAGYIAYIEKTASQHGIASVQPADGHYVVIAYINGVWRYEDNNGFNPVFTPEATDRIFATFTKSGNSMTYTPITCPVSGCTAINGMQTADVIHAGTFEPNWMRNNDSNQEYEMTLRDVLIGAGTVPDVKFDPVEGSFTIEPGDRIQGIYRFDEVRTLHGELLISNDPLRIGAAGVTQIIGPAAVNGSIEYLQPIVGKTVQVSGIVSLSSVKADDMTVAAGSVLSHPYTSYGSDTSLTLDIRNTLTVTGTIDASGRGYVAEYTYPGELGSTHGSSGSHIGRGGFDYGANPLGAPGASFGNLRRPQELGAGGGYTSGTRGGGRVRVMTNNLVIDGSILANGSDAGTWGGGSGGSLWITAGKITGNGLVEARGARTNNGGGGGAISVEYTDAQSAGSWLTRINAVGYFGSESQRSSGAGSVYIKGPANTNGNLTVDNGSLAGQTSELPSLASRTIIATTANGGYRLSGIKWVPPYLAGNDVEVTTAAGVVKGVARISAINNGWYRQVPVSEYYLLDSTSAMPPGYIAFMEKTAGQRGLSNQATDSHYAVIAFVSGAWRYEDNNGFNLAFTPDPTDRIFASFAKTNTTMTYTPIVCPATGCTAINGIQTAEVVRAGLFEPNIMRGGDS